MPPGLHRATRWLPSRRSVLLALMGLLLSLLTGCAGPSDLAPSPALPTACESPTGTRSVVVGLGRPGDPAQPGHSSGHWLGIKPVLSKNGGGVVMANPLANKAGCDRVKAGAFWPMPRKRRTWCGVWWSRSRLALAVVRLWCITTPPPKKCRPVTSAKPHRLLPLKTSSAGSCHRPNHALAMGHQRLQSNAPQPALDRQAGPGPGSASAAWRAWQPAVGETVWARLEACHQRLPDLAGAWPTRSPVREPIGCEHPTRWPIS